MLRVEHLTKELGAFHLRDISFTVADGEYFVILGESGVGKSVLLELITGIVSPSAGKVFWNDEDLSPLPIGRRRIGLVFQDQALFPHLTVCRNIAYGLPRAGRDGVEALAAEVGVSHLLGRYPETLSGGESQRVAVARTLAANPRCLLLDEPTAALDLRARGQLRALLRRLHKSGRTMLHVTHDFEEAVSLATRIGIMENGKVTQIGTPEEVFHRPQSEFVARFTGIRNVLQGFLDQRDDNMTLFRTDGVTLHVLADAPPGPGLVLLRSQDVTLSREPVDSSAQNVLHGTVVDLFPSPGGIEVLVDVGTELAALITRESLARLDLAPGKRVWASFRATAVQFVGDET